MPDLAAAIKALNEAAATLDRLQWVGVVFVLGVLGYFLLKPVLARGRKATQEMNLTLPPSIIPTNGNGGHNAAMIQDHVSRIAANEANISNLDKKLETMRGENRQDHQQIFNAINALPKR